jgi:hypothetical protein
VAAAEAMGRPRHQYQYDPFSDMNKTAPLSASKFLYDYDPYAN